MCRKTQIIKTHTTTKPNVAQITKKQSWHHKNNRHTLRKTGNMLNSRLNQGKSRPRAGQSRYSPKTALCLPVLPPFPPESLRQKSACFSPRHRPIRFARFDARTAYFSRNSYPVFDRASATSATGSIRRACGRGTKRSAVGWRRYCVTCS